jgi:hypothetical protein
VVAKADQAKEAVNQVAARRVVVNQVDQVAASPAAAGKAVVKGVVKVVAKAVVTVNTSDLGEF